MQSHVYKFNKHLPKCLELILKVSFFFFNHFFFSFVRPSFVFEPRHSIIHLLSFSLSYPCSIHPSTNVSIQSSIHSSSMHSFIHPHICSCTHPPNYSFIHLSSMHSFIHSCTYVTIHLSFYPPMHPCTHASMHPCIHAPMHPCTHASMHPCIHAGGSDAIVATFHQPATLVVLHLPVQVPTRGTRQLQQVAGGLMNTYHHDYTTTIL